MGDIYFVLCSLLYIFNSSCFSDSFNHKRMTVKTVISYYDPRYIYVHITILTLTIYNVH